MYFTNHLPNSKVNFVSVYFCLPTHKTKLIQKIPVGKNWKTKLINDFILFLDDSPYMLVLLEMKVGTQ